MKIKNSKFKVPNCSSKFKVSFRLLLLCLVFNFSFLIFHLDKAEASALSLSIDPPIIEIHSLPAPASASTIQKQITIQNKSESELNLQLHIKEFKAKNTENGEPEYFNSSNEFILKNIQVLENENTITSLYLGSGQQKSLDLVINVSTGEVGRDYYFSVIFISKPLMPIDSTSSLNSIAIATNVLLSIGPQEKPKIAIEEFTSPSFLQKGPVPFTVRLKNQGKHFIKPTGEIIIRNMFGQTIGKVDLKPLNVLSGATRAFYNKDYTKDLTMFWDESFLLGFYSATVDVYLDQNRHTTKTVKFFAFPIPIATLIVILVFIIVFIKRRLSKRRIK